MDLVESQNLYLNLAFIVVEYLQFQNWGGSEVKRFNSKLHFLEPNLTPYYKMYSNSNPCALLLIAVVLELLRICQLASLINVT